MPEGKSEILQGTLDLMVLKTLDAMGPLHGYGIARRIEQVSEDVLQLNQGTIYAALLRLTQRGWIKSEWGVSDNNRKAKFYSLTRSGRKQLTAQAKNWRRIAGVMGRLLDLAGRKGVPVFAGRNGPLRGTAEFPGEWRKIADDLPGVPLPPQARMPETKRAADYLVERLRTGRTAVRILALGPLTNIAEALEHDRSIIANIQEIVLMGGAVHVPGNLGDGGVFHTNNTTAEWNLFIDPLAASIVFRSGIPIRLIGLDATNKLPPETKRDWGTKIRMSDEVIEAVTKKWPALGLPGSGKSIWK